MFPAGPKNRTTAAHLAMFVGWIGLHKFYLGYRNVGLTHIALTVVGLVVFLAMWTAGDRGSVIVVQVAAWVAILLGYFYVRRFHFGDAVAEIISPGRLLLWPWRLIRYTFGLAGAGANMMEEEAHQQRWRRRRRRDDDDGGCLSAGCIVMALGILLSLAVVAAILFLYYLIFSLIGFIALAASVAIEAIEGVIYLRKTDTEFQNEYVVGQRLWF
ncbi:MAG: NINE protein [Chloroflexota bacterium]|nr:NINE protein [Chloroflexota bacterium]